MSINVIGEAFLPLFLRLLPLGRFPLVHRCQHRFLSPIVQRLSLLEKFVVRGEASERERERERVSMPRTLDLTRARERERQGEEK